MHLSTLERHISKLLLSLILQLVWNHFRILLITKSIAKTANQRGVLRQLGCWSDKGKKEEVGGQGVWKSQIIGWYNGRNISNFEYILGIQTVTLQGCVSHSFVWDSLGNFEAFSQVAQGQNYSQSSKMLFSCFILVVSI